jgi:hypothetical protein
MTVEVLTPASREEWLGLRKGTIGASEVAALLEGCEHPFLTAYELWASKTGRLNGSGEETAPMRRGRHIEAVAVDFLREERPSWRITANPIPGGKFYRDVEAGISATPDVFAVDPGREGCGVVQIKSLEPGVFRRKWCVDGAVEPPLYVAIQAIQEAHLTGASWAAVAPIVIGFGIDMPIIEVPIHGGVIEHIREAVGEFWAKVRSGEMPEPDWKRDAALAARLYDFEESFLDLSGSNRLPALLAKRARRKAYIKAAEAQCEDIEGEVREALGAATAARLPGWKITCKPVDRREFTVAARTIRPLRITPTKDAHA